MIIQNPETPLPLALTLFTRQFSALVDSGFNLVQICDTLDTNAPAPYADFCRVLRARLLADEWLTRTMGGMPDLFPPFYVQMIRVGEVGGILEEALRHLADLLEDEWRLTGPDSLESPLFASSSVAADWSDLNPYRQKRALMLFCRSFGVMYSSGVPMAPLLDTAADLLPAAQRDAVKELAKTEVVTGFPYPYTKPHNGAKETDSASVIADGLARLGFLPSLVTRLLAVGEQTGRIDAMMDNAADLYRHELLCLLPRQIAPAG